LYYNFNKNNILTPICIDIDIDKMAQLSISSAKRQAPSATPQHVLLHRDSNAPIRLLRQDGGPLQRSPQCVSIGANRVANGFQLTELFLPSYSRSICLVLTRTAQIQRVNDNSKKLLAFTNREGDTWMI
jgi:hypothetical protein